MKWTVAGTLLLATAALYVFDGANGHCTKSEADYDLCLANISSILVGVCTYPEINDTCGNYTAAKACMDDLLSAGGCQNYQFGTTALEAESSLINVYDVKMAEISAMLYACNYSSAVVGANVGSQCASDNFTTDNGNLNETVYAATTLSALCRTMNIQFSNLTAQYASQYGAQTADVLVQTLRIVYGYLGGGAGVTPQTAAGTATTGAAYTGTTTTTTTTTTSPITGVTGSTLPPACTASSNYPQCSALLYNWVNNANPLPMCTSTNFDLVCSSANSTSQCFNALTCSPPERTQTMNIGTGVYLNYLDYLSGSWNLELAMCQARTVLLNVTNGMCVDSDLRDPTSNVSADLRLAFRPNNLTNVCSELNGFLARSWIAYSARYNNATANVVQTLLKAFYMSVTPACYAPPTSSPTTTAKSGAAAAAVINSFLLLTVVSSLFAALARRG